MHKALQFHRMVLGHGGNFAFLLLLLCSTLYTDKYPF